MGMFESKAKKAARVERVTVEETFPYPAVADTNEAVAEKLYAMAGQVADPQLAASWRRTADGIKAGQIHPSIRRDYAAGTRFPKTRQSNARILAAERS
jgi:hypothetical protein